MAAWHITKMIHTLENPTARLSTGTTGDSQLVLDLKNLTHFFVSIRSNTLETFSQL